MNSARFRQDSRGKRLKTTDTTDSPPVVPPSSPEDVEVPAEAVSTELAEVNPMYASFFVLGRSRKIVDTISAVTSMCSPEMNQGLPVHFFAVYDGHHDDHVSRLCREWMHVVIEEEIQRVENNSEGSNGSSSNLGLEEKWVKVVQQSFEEMNEMAICDARAQSSGEHCRHSLEWDLCESAAVVTILTLDYIVVANCGGSRAVLCRAGRPIPLSVDHERDMPEELARITTSQSGDVILALARTMSDENLENITPILISEPDVTITKRETEDECLILASDGLWDVMTNEVACEIARECLRERDPAPSITEGNNSSHCFRAATMLARFALGVKSLDNISVIVIDLKNNN